VVRTAVPTYLYVCRVSPRHGPMHRRFQVALWRYRNNKTWASPAVRRLVEKYGAQEERC